MEMVGIGIVAVALVVIFLLLSARRYSCPECKGRVQRDARVCQHCGFRVPAAS